MDCEELFLNEIVHVELVAAAGCNFSVPFNVGEQTKMSGTTGTAQMVFDVNESTSNTSVLDSAPSLKTSEKPQAAGYLRTHELTIPARGNYNKVREAKAALAGVDFNVVLRTAAGTRFLLYALPNTSMVSVEDQMGAESKQTVKVSIESMSNMIELT